MPATMSKSRSSHERRLGLAVRVLELPIPKLGRSIYLVLRQAQANPTTALVCFPTTRGRHEATALRESQLEKR